MDINALFTAARFVNGAAFAGIDTLTEVKLTGGRRNPHQGRITKVMTDGSVILFQNKNINGYDSMVRRRLAAEGIDPASFTLSNRVWGKRLDNLPIVEHFKDGKNNYYLETIFLHPGKNTYLLDGQPINEADIIGLPVQKINPASQGGLSNQVIVRTFQCESITELRINKQVFR